MGTIQNSHLHYVIFGFGVSGKPTYKVLKSLGFKVSVINAGDIESWRGDDAMASDCLSQGSREAKERVDSADFIVLSPGIPRDHELLDDTKAALTNDIELFYQLKKTNPKIVAITGSNGKTTTVTLLNEMLENAGRKVFCGGNIGLSPMEFLLNGEKEDVVLLELSSFQLETIDQFSADISAILNITMTHEERYKNFDDYQEAKLRVFKNQKPGQKFYGDKKVRMLAEDVFTYDNDDVIQRLKDTYDLSSWHLPGEHNLLNLSLASLIALDLGLLVEEIQHTIKSFSGVKNRIEYLGNYKNAKVYNDSKSTNIFSSETAVDSFKGKKVLLILGGQIRSQEALNLNKIKILTEKCSTVVNFGELSQVKGMKTDFSYNNLSKLKLSEIFTNEDIILFSPGFPSFDEFKNYNERGNCFREIFSREK